VLLMHHAPDMPLNLAAHANKGDIEFLLGPENGSRDNQGNRRGRSQKLTSLHEALHNRPSEVGLSP